MYGRTEPREWTKPLRDLADPKSSYGYAVIWFAENVCKQPLDQWEQWLVIHAGELTQDNLPRFRQVLTIVARQNGKSFLLRVLAAFWLFVQNHPLVLGVANKLAVAKESLEATYQLALGIPALSRRIDKFRTTNGQEQLTTVEGSRYLINAAGKDAGRGLTVNRAIWDEVRQEENWETHSALVPTMAAVENAQLFMITNMGTVDSVVLNDTRRAALSGADGSLALFEWSAELGAEATDPEAWAAANPNLGHRVLVSVIAAEAARALASGGEMLTRFRTERLCQMVDLMDPAIDMDSWDRCLDPGEIDDRSRVTLALDVAPDSQHATVAVAAVMADGRIRVEILEAFEGHVAIATLRRELPGLISRVRPRVVAWLPGGPAASLAADMRTRFPGIRIEEIRSDTAAVCMSFADLVKSGQIAHSADALLDDHVRAAERLRKGDTWVFSRKSGHVDALYATASAVFMATTQPKPSGNRRFLSVD